MIAKVILFFAAVAAAHATVIAPGIAAPGLWNAGLLGAPVTTVAKTSSVVAIPGAVTTDKRVIGTGGVLAVSPLATNGLLANGLVANGLVANGLVANGLVANGLVANGLWGSPLASPLALSTGIISPLGLGIKGAGLLAAPGIAKIW